MQDRNVYFIGDEATAAGFRLAGLRVFVPDPDEAARCYREAQENASLIYLTPEVAEMIPETMLQAAFREADPLVMIVPDINRRGAPPDVEKEILGLLGLET
ncbi:MAG: hypothetical protein HKO95_09145 [Rhodobacteraceae bacterium]|jgi:vacuolar-type H+-ATPase subunit F/Vma7|nr:hypothetical protein [Alphaproteobacteria bacterium]NNK66890.1 hypothetical protein [Paracoccaceae bacterium]